MNPWFFMSWTIFSAFIGMTIIGIMYSTPMPFVATLAIILMVVLFIVGLVEDKHYG